MKRLELIEIPGHVGLLALGQPWMTVEHYADLMTACCLAHDLSAKDDPDMHALATTGIEMLEQNHPDLDAVKRVVGTVVQWVSHQPNIKIYNATVQRLKNLDEQERLSRNSAPDHL